MTGLFISTVAVVSELALEILPSLGRYTVHIEILLMNFPHRGQKLASLATTWVVGTQKCVKTQKGNSFIKGIYIRTNDETLQTKFPQFYLSPL